MSQQQSDFELEAKMKALREQESKDRQTKDEVDLKKSDPPEFLMQFFAYEHLAPKYQAVSKPFGDLAREVVENLPRNQERTVCLRKLLEAKDCAVRALVAK